MIWKQPFTLEGLNALNANTMADALEIRFTEIGADFITATMPANARTVQPFRMTNCAASAGSQ